jgi:hypothetical protein
LCVFLAAPKPTFRNGEYHQAFDQWKRLRGMPAAKLPTQAAHGRAACFCGAAIGIADVEPHIESAHMEQVSC